MIALWHETEDQVVHSCTSVTFARQALLVVNQVLVAGTFSHYIPPPRQSFNICLVILATRTIALYNISHAIIFGVLGFGLVLAGVTCVSPTPRPT